jgi:CBS domain-containing protein
MTALSRGHGQAPSGSQGAAKSVRSVVAPAANRLMAADLMSAPVVTAREDETVREAARRMLEHGLGAMPVVSAAGAAIGMVSDGDLLGHRQRDPRREWWLDLLARGGASLAPPHFVDDRPVREVMSAPLVTISPRTSAAEIAELMRLNHVKRLPVIAQGALVGIVSRVDLIGLVETMRPPKDRNEGNALLEFFEGLIGGASLRGLPVRRPAMQVTPAKPRAPAFTAAALRAEAERFESDRQSQFEAERAAVRLKRQRELKAMLQSHVDEALWRDLMDHAEAAAARGEIELQLLQFPCALCVDGGRMIDVHEAGWETTLRGEPAEIYARWRDELQPQGFRIDARMIGWDEQGIIAESGLFLQWGAKAQAGSPSNTA